MTPSKRRAPSGPSSPRPARPAPEPEPAPPPTTPAYAPLARLNYFDGHLLGVDDFTTEQSYFLDRARRHNMALHGCGVVSGLEVALGDGEVRVAAGLALDCAGNEIVLARPMSCPLPEQDEALFVVVAYAEVRTRPVPVVGDGGAVAAPSRIVEDVAFALEPADPCAGHAARGHAAEPCGAAHGLALARLTREKRGWKLDPRFAPRRVRA